MKTGTIHFARSAMLTEYLRYIWARPAPVHIQVQGAAFSLPAAAPVPVKSLTKQQGGLDPKADLNLAGTEPSF
jgi:hypothetical protein